MRERLDVVDHGGLAVEPARDGERRLQPRLRPPPLDHLEERSLFPADVAARAREDLGVEGVGRAEHVLAENPFATRHLESLGQDLRFRPVLVADVDDAAACPGEHTGHGHALDDEVRHGGEDTSILDGPWFALVRVADHVLFVPGCVAHSLPLDRRAETCASHATELGSPERGEDRGRLAGLDETPQRRKARVARLVGIHAQTAERRKRGRPRQGRALPHGANEGRAETVGEPPVRLIVYGSRRRTVAPPEARDRRHSDLVRRPGRCRGFELAEKRSAPTQPARHVRAHPDIEYRGRLESEVREECREAVQVVARDTELSGERTQDGWWQVALVMALRLLESLHDAAAGALLHRWRAADL